MATDLDEVEDLDRRIGVSKFGMERELGEKGSGAKGIFSGSA